MVYVADIAVPAHGRVLHVCDTPGDALKRAAGEYEEWATTRAREKDPDAAHVRWLPASTCAAARRAKRLRTTDPEVAFAGGEVVVDERAGFRVTFRRLADLEQLRDVDRAGPIAA